MYAKCLLFFCLLGFSTILSAQTADNTRISISLHPTQILAIATAKDIQDTEYQSPSMDTNHNKGELRVSNLYGSQITLLNEKQYSSHQDENIKNDNSCSTQSKIVYSQRSAVVDKAIATPHFSSYSKDSSKKCAVSDTSRMLVYLIVTQ